MAEVATTAAAQQTIGPLEETPSDIGYPTAAAAESALRAKPDSALNFLIVTKRSQCAVLVDPTVFGCSAAAAFGSCHERARSRAELSRARAAPIAA